MKKQVFTYFCIVTFSLFSFFTVNAQEEQDFTQLPPITISATTSSTAVSAKLNKAFSKLFKDVSNVRWYKIDKNYLVKFIQHEQENRALFNKRSNLIYSVSYGKESNLPDDVRKLVKSNYVDQDIKRIIKVSEQDRNIWVVNLEDTKDYIWVRVENMELEETQRLKKTM